MYSARAADDDLGAYAGRYREAESRIWKLFD